MGHVSARPFSATGPDHELSRREHRGAGAGNRALAGQRVARLGEALAASFLAGRGATVVGRNVRVGRGEIDLLVRMRSLLVAVEVKTRVGRDPRAAYTAEKADRVWAAVGRLTPRPRRVDLVAVTLTSDGADIRWVPGVR